MHQSDASSVTPERQSEISPFHPVGINTPAAKVRGTRALALISCQREGESVGDKERQGLNPGQTQQGPRSRLYLRLRRDDGTLNVWEC